MKILLLSDIHDNVWALKTLLQSKQAAEADVLVCCGDLCSPFMIDLLSACKKPVHIVLGNNDCDVAAMTGKLSKYPGIKIHGEYYRDELDNTTIAVNHYPENAQKLVQLQAYDVVCYGHDHSIFVRQEGKTLLLNPGAVMGFDARQLKDIDSSFMVYNTRSNAVDAYRIILKGGNDIARWDAYCMGSSF
ncbi:metallophosphoesterase family protein [Parafilimonas sp.]|uniref:metallophosphoesterase family protein n=1 Tax=Parafilimonas sp. TaxID=1969739 RepID=UPI0039E6AA6A